MSAYHADLTVALSEALAPDLFGAERSAADESARLRLLRRLARNRRREAVAPYITAPWLAWTAEGEAARTARRFLRRHPDFDIADPNWDFLTGAQRRVESLMEEAALDATDGKDRW